MILERKNAVIYGGGGAIGGAVARAFAAAGARVFVAGRTADKLETVAKEIRSAGGSADVAVLDALDEQAVDEHAQSMVAAAGSIDISFNLVSRGDVQGTSLMEMSTADFVDPITTGMTTQFVTARAAARQMTQQGSGVILALDSGSAQGSPMMGATGPADAATDVFVRNLASELGPHGIRVLGIWAAGIPDSLSRETLAATNPDLQMDEASFRGLLDHLDQLRITQRSPKLADIAALATFLASDNASALTGTFVNATQMFVS